MRISNKRNRLLRYTQLECMNAYLSSAKLLSFILEEILAQGQFMLQTGHLSPFLFHYRPFELSFCSHPALIFLSLYLYSAFVYLTLLSLCSRVWSINQLINLLYFNPAVPRRGRIKEIEDERKCFGIY